ncbi:hypothetical protein BaRGS_00028718 [Batillaria attramentaria]|uniref:EF-hand domain-containing protein n=1 Tax=Batillaria attramentaria TaxID=370345 RepID=A0ABD0JYG2_9CAEN
MRSATFVIICSDGYGQGRGKMAVSTNRTAVGRTYSLPSLPSISEDDEIQQESVDLTEPSQAVMEQMMVAKATELFKVCDTEEKGFITKRDMQRLRNELPVSPDQLEIVFDSLDVDKNGFLTLEEFTEGFGSFVGIQSRSGAGAKPDKEASGDVMDGDVFEGQGGDAPDMEKAFDDMMMQIDGRGVFQDEDVIRAMWQKLHRDEPDLVSSFEEFLGRTAAEMKRSRGEFDTLEAALKTRTNEHEEEVKKLYEEMEFQMKREQQRILSEEKQKEKQLREEMESALLEKERQLQEMQNRHQEMEEKLAKLNKEEAATKEDNQRLKHEKEMLEDMLVQSQETLEESRSYIDILQSQQRDEEKTTSKRPPVILTTSATRAALQLSEGIALERESLVKQLDMLKDVNKRLLDDKDEAEAVEARREDDEEDMEALGQNPEQPPKRELVKQGSLLSKYFPGCPYDRSSEAVPEGVEEADMSDIDDDGIEMDDLTDVKIYTFHGAQRSGLPTDTKDSRNKFLTRDDALSIDSDTRRQCASMKRLGSNSPTAGRKFVEDNYTSDAESEAVVKKSSASSRVVFVGDSGVGKSSFIHRFCNNQFRASYAATIGVDFQIRALTVGDSTIVLQLWDTAGQERYRSVTKQYFRKADGVIVMYDVTSERSFLNVRDWMFSVQEGVEEGTVITIVGNKTDIVDADPEHVTKVKDGSKMAVEYDALFYETSANLLKDKEDKALEASLQLTDPPKKKGCSSGKEKLNLKSSEAPVPAVFTDWKLPT